MLLPAKEEQQSWPQPLLNPCCLCQGPGFPCSSLQDQASLSWVKNLLQIKQEMRWV